MHVTYIQPISLPFMIRMEISNHYVPSYYIACNRDELCMNSNTIKSPKHAAHGVLRNRPTLSIGTERLAAAPLACSWGPSPSTRQVPGSSPGPGGRAARAFFSTLPSFLLGDFFRTFPTNPTKVLGLFATCMFGYKEFKILVDCNRFY